MESIHSALALVFGVLAGTTLFAMVGRWIYAVASAVKSYRASETSDRAPSLWSVIVSGLLHSGPWALAIASYLSYFVLSQPHAAWWSWFFGGACVGPLFILAAALRAARRKKQPQEPYTPLAAEALDSERKRTVRWITVVYGGGMSAISMFFIWQSVHAPELIVLVLPVCLGGGYVFALIMWQWKKSLLQARDYERRKAQRGG